LRCTFCGFANLEGTEFCRECGRSLVVSEETGSVPESERKIVTVMFADVSGFTAMSESLDPEEVSEVMHEVLRRLGECVVDFGGVIDKYTGDGLMALFGAPIAHEDDPERSIRAAIWMITRMGDVNAQVGNRLVKPLDIHIGINTGLVVAGRVGGGAKREYTVFGDAVNVAARLESLSEAGQILVGERTARIAERTFDFETLPPVEVKGKKEALQPRLVIGAKARPRPARGVEELERVFVDRDAETATLRKQADATWSGGGRLVLITGEPGIGKSSLWRDLAGYALQHDVRVAAGFCSQQMTRIPYLPVAELIRSVLGVEDSDDEGAVVAKVALGARELAETESRVIARLVGVRANDPFADLDAEGRKAATFAAVREFFTTTAGRKPHLLVVEDVHWADPISQEVLISLCDRLRSWPTLMVVTARPEYETDHFQEDECTVIRLWPLSESDSGELFARLLPSNRIPDTLHDVIWARSEGNPLFLEEILRSLIDAGALVRTDDEWRVEGEISDVQVPETLHGVLAGRIDGLPASAKQLLQLASCWGERWPRSVIARVFDEETFDENLSVLRRLFFTMDAPTENDEEVFLHSLVADVAYSGLLKSKRRHLHGLLARSLEEDGELLSRTGPAVMARHHFESYHPERATPYLIEAGRIAKEEFANEDAMVHLCRAVELLESEEESDEVNDQLSQVHRMAGRVLMHVGNTSKAEEHLRAGLEASIRAGLGSRQGWILVALSDLYLSTDRSGEALRAADSAFAFGTSTEDVLLQAQATMCTAAVRAHIGDYETALAKYDEARTVLIETTDRKEQARCYANMSPIYLKIGDTARGLEHAKKALDIRREIGDRQGAAYSLQHLGGCYDVVGNREESIVAYREALQVFEQIGDRRGQASTLMLVGVAAGRRGDHREAIASFRSAAAMYADMRDGGGEAYAATNLATVSLKTGDIEQAIAGFDRALIVCEKLGDQEGVLFAALGLGKARTESDDFVGARSALDKAHDAAHETGMTEGHRRVAVALAELAVEQGDVALAVESLTEAEKLATELGSAAGLADVAYCRGRLAVAEGEPEKALLYLNRSAEAYESAGVVFNLGRANLARGTACALTGAVDDAVAAFDLAEQAFEKTGAVGWLARVEVARLRLRESDEQ
jgi:predicted ATPase/class 3 adenylate cyclase